MTSTGLEKLDKLLSGGIKKGLIHDIFGASATGKTQLASQISISFLKQGGKVLFQDTTGKFRPERMLEIIKTQNIDLQLLENVEVNRITNTSEQIKSLDNIHEKNDFSLIVIDNVTDLFSFEYSDEKKIFKKNMLFMNYMHKLALISVEKEIPIIVTNTVRSFDNYEKENLEKAISIYTHLKIKLSKNNSKYLGEIFLPNQKHDFSYIITQNGLQITS